MVVASVDLYKIWEVKTMGKERDAEAKKMLEDAAKQVQPIMRKRKWEVALLEEFSPRDPRLLGLNVGGGQKIMIRLRRHGRELEFYPYESVLGTLLHELTHNECGSHDAKFYKLLDEITQECEVLMAKGISGTGQGFDAAGKRLGGYHHNPPASGLRQAALAAAEKRARTGLLMPRGPRRLGGDSSIMRDLTPVQAAAMAAERRLRDDVWCAAPATSAGDGLQGVADVRGSSGSQNERVNNIPLPATVDRNATGEGTSSVQHVEGRAGSRVGFANPRSADVGLPVLQQPSSSKQTSPETWECSVCTLLNHLPALSCGACGTEAGIQSFSHWTCSQCTLQNPSPSTSCEACGAARENKPQPTSAGEEKNPHVRVPDKVADIPLATVRAKAVRTWTCKQCTLDNTVLLDNCAACEQWRFSHGPPISSRGPAGT